MFFVPGFLITLITFPGVIVHELAHQLCCRWLKVPVFKVVYFKMGNPAGYVLHEVPDSQFKSVVIGMGPFIFNTIIGALIALPAALPVFTFHNATPLDYILVYLGVSIAMHAFPSTGDAKTILKAVKSEGTPLWVKVLAYPLVALIYAGSIGSFFWLDLLYGIGVAVGLPNLIIYLFS